MDSSTLTVRDYTVGWICALQIEHVVACELLDEEYDSPPHDLSRHDHNAYTYGRIGTHNLVIAYLPRGSYGTISAASVARDMQRSFPSLRFGLMVGIGGGAPTTKHDIRLGDVVVSIPVGRSGGVIQYDRGKVIQDRIFEPTGYLNKPPPVLLNALQNLSTRHKRKGHRIAETIATLITRNPRLASDYARPASESDVLYTPHFVHSDPARHCEDLCSHARHQVIERRQRGAGEDDPATHYGLIASANLLMKDALVRDQLAETEGVLCFETEAAGLMDGFPCIVIRGISDYSDSHKNDMWQGYAAATAAAYSKELLLVMSHRPLNEIPVRDTEDISLDRLSLSDVSERPATAPPHLPFSRPPAIDVTSQTHGITDHATSSVESWTALGIDYYGIGGKTGPIETSLRKNETEDAFVLYFTEALKADNERWVKHRNLLLELVERFPPPCVIAVVDCDAIGVEVERVHIKRYRNGRVVFEDVLYHIQNGLPEATCTGSPAPDTRENPWAVSRNLVDIPCPGPSCSNDIRQRWACKECGSPLEYDPTDARIYCNCGGCNFTEYAFRCKELEHGTKFVEYDPAQLKDLLMTLRSSDDLNILVIGERGVGKSTWINSFVYYLRHNTLDDAMEDEDFCQSKVESSFVVISRDDSTGDLTPHEVPVGRRRHPTDANRGKRNATRPDLCLLWHGNTLLRLIDTLGLGGGHQPENDREIIGCNLAALQTHQRVHGILLLLRPDRRELDDRFRFIVSEYLTHFHLDAARNLVFGFTHTRVSNYTPGETFTPLQKLLKEYSNFDFTLSHRNCFCFDSESFRFLAARNQGLEFGSVEDFRLSWNKSKSETQRLLRYLKTLAPHSVESTLGLSRVQETATLVAPLLIKTCEKFAVKIAQNQRRLEKLKSDSDIWKTSHNIKRIQKTIADDRREWQQVEQTTCQMARFLKANSITPYDDVIISYIDHVMARELSYNVNESGMNRAKLRDLRQYRQERLQKGAIIADDAPLLDAASIQNAASRLYALKHFRDTVDETMSSRPDSSKLEALTRLYPVGKIRERLLE